MIAVSPRPTVPAWLTATWITKVSDRGRFASHSIRVDAYRNGVTVL